MDLSLWFFRLVSKPRNGLAFILNTFQICWVAPAWIQYSNLLGLHSFEKIEQSYNYMYERTV